jgi:Fur family ferric uptake transcriptional regulator
MTQAARGPRLAFGGIEDVAAAVRARGGRFSTSLRLVLEALFAADGPVSAEYIAGGSDGRGPVLDPTSVYRNLERLEQLGVVRHVHLGHGAGRYALATSELEYLACERCDAVIGVDAARLDPLRDEIRAAFGFEAHFGHFPIVGLCARCAAAADA